MRAAAGSSAWRRASVTLVRGHVDRSRFLADARQRAASDPEGERLELQAEEEEQDPLEHDVDHRGDVVDCEFSPTNFLGSMATAAPLAGVGPYPPPRRALATRGAPGPPLRAPRRGPRRTGETGFADDAGFDVRHGCVPGRRGGSGPLGLFGVYARPSKAAIEKSNSRRIEVRSTSDYFGVDSVPSVHARGIHARCASMPAASMPAGPVRGRAGTGRR